MVKIHFLQKVLKKWSSFRKKIKKFSITGGGGGGSGPYMEFSIIDFIFFFEPFPYLYFMNGWTTARYLSMDIARVENIEPTCII